MDAQLFRAMYGYIPVDALEKAGGEGSRGGKVIGHTASGKPIYDADQREQLNQPISPSAKKNPARKPYPGEESHNTPKIEGKVETFMPIGGTEFTHYDTPNLKAYKILMRTMKKMGINFMGHISYDPKTDKILAISKKAPELIRQAFDTAMKEQKLKARG